MKPSHIYNQLLTMACLPLDDRRRMRRIQEHCLHNKLVEMQQKRIAYAQEILDEQAAINIRDEADGGGK